MELKFEIAQTPSEQAIEAGRKLFRGEVDFVKGVVGMQHLPPADRIEFCFAGRSNVGKSSLINALTGRKALARASSTPGRTQEINFFALGSEHYMVDLPGYGYANAPLEKVKSWQKLLKSYLQGRVSLRRIYLLIDARHGSKAVDNEIMDLLDSAAVTFQIIVTKTDKVKGQALDEALEKIRKDLQNHPAAFPEILLSSSEKGEGIGEIRANIACLV